MIFEKITVGALAANCYILSDGPKNLAVIIDPGSEAAKIKKALAKHGLKPGIVINTHGHYDHISEDDSFGVEVYCHKDDVAFLRDSGLNLSNFLVGTGMVVKSAIKPLEDRQLINCDGIALEVIHTPGHTPGGISLWLKKPREDIIFSGDTLFRESVGRTDIALASHEKIMQSIQQRLMALDDKVEVYPGHGPGTTIGWERKHNPFLV